MEIMSSHCSGPSTTDCYSKDQENGSDNGEHNRHQQHVDPVPGKHGYLLWADITARTDKNLKVRDEIGVSFNNFKPIIIGQLCACNYTGTQNVWHSFENHKPLKTDTAFIPCGKQKVGTHTIFLDTVSKLSLQILPGCTRWSSSNSSTASIV